ncbi:MAG: flavin reductase family protein [Planctomycetota bacterium]|nr:MAG: flavin reductase family protein [Planctomycetota bacterium]
MDRYVTIDPDALRPSQKYAWMIAVVVPRPIGWVTTRSPGGVVNLAPFSFFNGVTSHPPIVSLGIGRRRDGTRKDTARNILDTGEFVAHLVEHEHLEAMVASSAELPPEASEPEQLGLELVSSERVGVPALAAARVRLECRLERHIEIGDGPSDFILGRVLAFRVRSDLLAPDGSLDQARLAPMGRLGGALYAPVERRVEVARPGLPRRLEP